MKKENLIDAFWSESKKLEKRYEMQGVSRGTPLDLEKYHGLCGCQVPWFLKNAENSSEMRSFFLISTFIDQIMYTHCYGIYCMFRKSFRYPKLWSHFWGGCDHPSFFVQRKYYGDRELDWEYTEMVFKTLISDTKNWFYKIEFPEDYGKRRYQYFLSKFISELVDPSWWLESKKLFDAKKRLLKLVLEEEDLSYTPHKLLY